MTDLKPELSEEAKVYRDYRSDSCGAFTFAEYCLGKVVSLRADLARLSHMIPVSERLPEPKLDEKFLAYAGKDYGYFMSRYVNLDAKGYPCSPYWWDFDLMQIVSGVTHWYPLPPLPGGEGMV